MLNHSEHVLKEDKMFVKVKSGDKFYFVKISEPGSEDFTPNKIIL